MLTTKDDITFDVYSRPEDPEGSVDFYKNELWIKKGLEKWGNAEDYIPNVESVEMSVSYKDYDDSQAAENKRVKQLEKKIEDISDQLNIYLNVHLKTSYQKNKALEIEKGIYDYYSFLLENDGSSIEMMVEYEDETGTYSIQRDEYDKMPIIKNMDDITRRLEIFSP